MKASALAFAEAIFAVLALGIFLYLAINAEVDKATAFRIIGLVLGMITGFLSVSMGVFRQRAEAYAGVLRVLELVFSPLGGVGVIVISGTLGTGYLLGSVASFALGHSLKGLIELPVPSTGVETGQAKGSGPV